MSGRAVAAVGLWAAFTPALALAHAGLTVPAPRNTDVRSGTSIKSGPCGPHAAGTGVRTRLTAGAQFTVEFIETINHPGYFQLFFSEVGDTNYVLLLDQIPHSNAAPQPSFANPRPYTQSITVPNVSCSNCSLQLIQVMTENPARPTLYFSCADIEIVGGPTPDAGVVVVPDAGLPEDSGVHPDAAVVVQPDAAEPPDSGAVVVSPDSGVVVVQPDAEVVQPDAAEPVPAPDAGSPPTLEVTRNQVGGGCATAPAGELGLLAVLMVGLAARRRSR